MTGDRSAPGQHAAADARGMLPWRRLPSTGNLEYDRVLFFTDAIRQFPAIVFYAAGVSLTGLAELALWCYACRVPGLLSAETTSLAAPGYRAPDSAAPSRLRALDPGHVRLAVAGACTWILVAVLGIGIRQVMNRSGRTGSSELELFPDLIGRPAPPTVSRPRRPFAPRPSALPPRRPRRPSAPQWSF